MNIILGISRDTLLGEYSGIVVIGERERAFFFLFMLLWKVNGERNLKKKLLLMLNLQALANDKEIMDFYVTLMCGTV